ncbi:High-affinity nickel transport protein [bacterium HR23]|nr:High-affinity nickel transport protein [bacterium HR23]
MTEKSLVLLALGTLVLGLRHGIDWDHIAAIADLTGAQPTRLRGFIMGTIYALGHAFVVVVLGLLALWFGTLLPEWVDAYLERVVGATLAVLGVWIFWSLLQNPEQFRLRSRWMLIFDAFKALSRRTLGVLRRQPAVVPVGGGQPADAPGPLASWNIGMIHGIGAETGSQALLLASVAGVTSPGAGSLLLLTFTLGLVFSNSVITLASTLGFLGAQSRRRLYITLGVVAGIFSLTLGILFLLGKGTVLPHLLA